MHVANTIHVVKIHLANAIDVANSIHVVKMHIANTMDVANNTRGKHMYLKLHSAKVINVANNTRSVHIYDLNILQANSLIRKCKINKTMYDAFKYTAVHVANNIRD